jgi:hypothetical protein
MGTVLRISEKYGCRLESATESISEEEPEGRLKNNIMMSVAEFERLNTAKKTRLKMLEQAKRGYWNGGPVPYGYSYDKNTQSLQPHPNEAPVLRRIFQESAKLVSLTEISNTLNTEGLRTKERIIQRKNGKTQATGGRLFRSDGLRLIIRNPIYRGAVKFEGQEFAGRHEALVSVEVWEKANAAAADIQERPGQVDHPSFQARDVHNHLFKGIAFCATCERALVPSDSGKRNAFGAKYRYYVCNAVLKEEHTVQCTVGRLSADALEKAVVAVLGEVSKHPSIIKEMVEVSRSTRRKDTAVLQSAAEKQKQLLTSVEKQLDNCAIAISKGGVDVLGDALVRRVSDLRKQRRRLLVELERTRQELTASNALVLEEQHIRKNLERFGEVLSKLTPSEQKELIRLLIERIDVRRIASPKRRETEPVQNTQASDRLMEICIRLFNAELVQGLEERERVRKELSGPSSKHGSLSLDTRVDFKNAMHGEITLVAPVRQVVRLDQRRRMVRSVAPKVEHPVVLAQKWQQMLLSGEVATRSELARKFRHTPSAVSRILKMVELAPDIQAYLASLTTANAVWHFGYRPLGALAQLPFDEQKARFAKLRMDYEALQVRRAGRHGALHIQQPCPAVLTRSAS